MANIPTQPAGQGAGASPGAASPAAGSSPGGPSAMSRRGFLKGVGIVGAGAVIVDHPLLRAAENAPAPVDTANKPVAGEVEITLSVNGQDRKVNVEPRTTLLSALRDRLDPPITGPKLVCDAGTCGACTVLLDGKNVYGCMNLAIDVVGKKITTVEGIGTPENLSPIQSAFVAKDAMMCGFCTSGFITTLTALFDKKPNPSEEEVRSACAGNFCRCGTYPRIFEAAMSVSEGKNDDPAKT